MEYGNTPYPRYGSVSVELGGDFTWYLTQPLQVEREPGVVEQIPPGLRTDFASLPVGIRCIVRHNGRAARPSVVHDDAYRRKRMTRKTADRQWLAGLEAEGAFGPVGRRVLYYGLRSFGWWAWRKPFG